MVAQAYTLVQFLLHGEQVKHRAGFARYLESAFQGQGAAGHLERALGRKADEIEEGWKAYVQQIAGQRPE